MTSLDLLADLEAVEFDDPGRFGNDTTEPLADDLASTSSSIDWLTERPNFLEIIHSDSYHKFHTKGISSSSSSSSSSTSSIEELVKATELLIGIEAALDLAARWTRDRFSLRLPELSSLLHDDAEYARTALAIGWDCVAAGCDLGSFLSSQQVLLVATACAEARLRDPSAMAASSQSFSAAMQLHRDPATAEKVAALVEDGCRQVLQLDGSRSFFHGYIAQHIRDLAPNLSDLVGPTIAARLIGAAGGLGPLGKITGNALCALGPRKQKVALGGYSLNQSHRTGVIWECELIQTAPEALATIASRLVSQRCALASRIDLNRAVIAGAAAGEPSDWRGFGKAWYEEIKRKIDKKQRPQQVKQVKQHKPPIQRQKRTHRAGRQHRAYKKRFAPTQEKIIQNRVYMDEGN